MIPAIRPGEDALDLGRHPTTMAEFEARFVTHPDFASSTTRSGIWQEWQAATDYLRQQLPVAAVWIGGSFVTAKLDPSDLDCTYLLDHSHVAQAQTDPVKATVLAQFSTPNAVESRIVV